MLINTPYSYGSLSKALHWISALIIFGLLGIGLYMTGLDDEAPNRISLYNFHKAMGVLVLMLLIVRVIWLRISHGPTLPPAFEAKDRAITKGVQGLLYLLMALLPISGYVMSTAAGYPTKFFGLFELPMLFDKSKALGDFAHTMHSVLGYAIIAFILLHMAGAIKHRLQDKNGESDILKRML